jgi:suppressor of ftsI
VLLRPLLVLFVPAALVVAILGGSSGSDWNPKSGLPLTEPVQLHSSGGVLRLTLDAKRRTIDVSGDKLKAQPFNGQLLGPTLHVRPGDRLEVTIRNATSESTNIHYHGMHVSPLGDSDNVFRVFKPGQTVHSVITLPGDHPVGTYWYHVHLHGLTEEQVMGGMSGLLIVDGLEAKLPAGLRGIRQRQLAIRDVQTKGDSIIMDNEDIDPSKPTTRLVNGLLLPRFGLRSGETQLWRIANVGADIFYDIALEGHAFRVLAEDGSPVWTVVKKDHLMLPPGKRYDVLVQGGKPGTYAFKTLKYDEGFQALPTTDLAKVVVSGPARAPTRRLPTSMNTRAGDLTHVKVARKRVFTFKLDFNDDEFRALINGRQFNDMQTPVGPVLGTTEEWTLKNDSTEDHPFHIHVNDFQIMKVNGKPYRANGTQDVVIIPKNGGTVVVRQRFEDFTGQFVFHCHILGHEDAGMMKAVDVVRKGQKPVPAPMRSMPGMTGMEG